jgi:hypothetical protein
VIQKWWDKLFKNLMALSLQGRNRKGKPRRNAEYNKN